MGLIDRARRWIHENTAGAPPVAMATGDVFPDLPLVPVLEAEITEAGNQPASRRAIATVESVERRLQLLTQQTQQQREAILGMPGGLGIDPDDDQFRRLTGRTKTVVRDLAPLTQDKVLEIAWYLWESNGLARRLIELETDLIVGEGITIETDDERIADAIAQTWQHPSNRVAERLRPFYHFLSLTGELILPCAVNPITGRPVFGFIDPSQVQRVIPLDGNVLIPDFIELKPEPGQAQGQQLKVIRVNPQTDLLEGELFYFNINMLPNSQRGRSDLIPLADWLDAYDQYLFSEVERLQLLSAFVWDYKINNATPDVITAKKNAFPNNPKPGTVFVHNDQESLEAISPDLKGEDRTEVLRQLRIHIAGSKGFPTSYLGDTDSNRATIEGQNDVLMKTPAARQKEFAAMLGFMVRFTIEQTTGKNRALFRDASTGYRITMPEIATKDVSRVGGVLAQVATAMDTSVQGGLISKRVATTSICAVLAHLGINEDPAEVIKEAEQEAQDRQDRADEMQAGMMAAAAKSRQNNPNPPIPGQQPAGDRPAA